MSNPDCNSKEFEAWLASGLKKPLGARDDFLQRVLDSLEEQKARRLLEQTLLHKRILIGSAYGVISAGLGLLFYPPVYKRIFTVTESILDGLAQLVLQPSLEGLILPAVVVLVAAVIVWNLIEMVSLE